MIAPLTACEDKKASPVGGHAAATRVVQFAAGVPKMQNEALAPAEEANTENYQHFFENAYVSAVAEPRSTFSASVDTAAYTIVRSKIHGGQLPPKDAVRIADLLNYFDYDYPQPQGDAPVAATLEMAPCPWNHKHHLLRVALEAKKLSAAEMPPRNLVFLIDTSGSMDGPNRLPLVKETLSLLVEQLSPQDRVSIVTYAGDWAIRLEPTRRRSKTPNQVSHRHSPCRRLDQRRAAGSSRLRAGRQDLHRGRRQPRHPRHRRRLQRRRRQRRRTGSHDRREARRRACTSPCSASAWATCKDAKLEQLAHHGNGHYAYIDSLDEASKLFVDQGAALGHRGQGRQAAGGIQSRPGAAYRLIGYENRILKNEDFRNDAKDAGDMGSGHTVTALYEIVPPGVPIQLADAGDLKYQGKRPDTKVARTGEWLTLRMRYKDPDTDDAREIAFSLPANGLRKSGSTDFRFAASVAAFGLLLRDSEYKGSASWPDVKEWANASLGHDQKGYRRDFLDLVDQAEKLTRKRD